MHSRNLIQLCPWKAYFRKTLTLSIFVLLSSDVMSAGQAHFKFSTGVDYSSGDYGDAIDTNITYVPFAFSYEYFPWTVKITVPWLQIEGPGDVIGGGDDIIVINSGGALSQTRESGLGDVVAALQYSVEAIPAEVMFLDLTTKIKFPTADEDKGLGTGEVDYTFQADLAKAMGKLTPLATLGYKIKTDSDTLTLDNVWFGSLGADYKINDKLNFGATLDYQEASTSTAENAFEAFTYLFYKLTNEWAVTGYGYFGFTDGSPNEGIGISFRYRR